jgi:hypothetical protein
LVRDADLAGEVLSTVAGALHLGALVVLLAVAYLPSGRRRVRGFSGAASLTATVAAVAPGRSQRLTRPFVTYTSLLIDLS